MLLVSLWVNLSSIWRSFLLWIIVVFIVEVRVGVAVVAGIMCGIVQTVDYVRVGIGQKV